MPGVFEPRHDKTCIRGSDYARHKPGCTTTEHGKSLEISDMICAIHVLLMTRLIYTLRFPQSQDDKSRNVNRL